MIRVLLLAFLVVGVRPLAAQRFAPESSDQLRGTYVTGGVGVASTSRNCSGCSSTGNGIALRSVFGWRLVRRVGVGIHIDGETRAERPTREYQVHIVAGVDAYLPHHLVLRGGIGTARVALLSATTGKTLAYKGHGAGWLVGLGYEHVFIRRLDATPFVTYRRSGSFALRRDGTPVISGYSFHSLEVGMSVTWSLRHLIGLGFGEQPPE